MTKSCRWEWKTDNSTKIVTFRCRVCEQQAHTHSDNMRTPDLVIQSLTDQCSREDIVRTFETQNHVDNPPGPTSAFDRSQSYDYLATPYSDPESAVQHLRFIAAKLHTAHLLAQGIHIYSSIVHCHDIASTLDMPHDANFWEQYNFAMLYGARRMRILKLPNWSRSKGVAGEIEEAKRLGLEIIYDDTAALRELVAGVYGFDYPQ